MKYKMLTVLFAVVVLVGCATPQQKTESEALYQVHKAERKVAVDELKVKATGVLLDAQKGKLASDTDVLTSAKNHFNDVYSE